MIMLPQMLLLVCVKELFLHQQCVQVDTEKKKNCPVLCAHDFLSLFTLVSEEVSSIFSGFFWFFYQCCIKV